MKAVVFAAALSLLWATGCSTVPSDYKDPEDVVFQEADHGFKVWRAETVDVRAYDTLIVHATQASAKPPDKPEEIAQFNRFLGRVQTDLLNNIINRNLFTSVVMNDAPLRSEARVLHLETTVLDYYAGIPATRVLVGFGAGEPHFLARSVLRDGESPLMRFIAKRKFEWGGGSGDEERLNNEVLDFAKDFSELLATAHAGKSLKRH